MTPLNYYTLILLTPLLLFHTTQSSATTPNRIDQLKIEHKKLKSKTQAMKEQSKSDQIRIEQLKHKIKHFRIQNKALDQRILKEIERYKNTGQTTSNDEM